MNPVIKKFIEDAIKEDWLYLGQHRAYMPINLKAPGVAQFSIDDGINFLITKEQALLDPRCWEAVGRARGWAEDNHLRRSYESYGSWRGYKFLFNEYINDGMTIEEALSR